MLRVDYLLWDFKGNDFYSGYIRRLELPSGASGQAEGIAYLPDRRIFISNEELGVPARISEFTDVYTQTQVSGITDLELKPLVTINGHHLNNQSLMEFQVKLFSSNGQIIDSFSLKAGEKKELTLTPGIYIAYFTDENGSTKRSSIVISGQ